MQPACCSHAPGWAAGAVGGIARTWCALVGDLVRWGGGREGALNLKESCIGACRAKMMSQCRERGCGRRGGLACVRGHSRQPLLKSAVAKIYNITLTNSTWSYHPQTFDSRRVTAAEKSETSISALRHISETSAPKPKCPAVRQSPLLLHTRHAAHSWARPAPTHSPRILGVLQPARRRTRCGLTRCDRGHITN